MAIIRSKIARQLLAEGGAPRKGFANGTGFEGSPEMGGSRSDSPSPSSFDDGFGGGDENPRPTYSQQLTDIQSTGSTFPNLNKITPRDLFKVSADNPMLQRSLMERAMLQMTPFGTAINLGEMNAFNLPMFRFSRTGGTNDRFNNDEDGSDNIVMPILPKVPKLPSDIEPEQSDMAEFIAGIRGANPTAFDISERFRLAEGGEPRQEYGLGSIVKKITGTVKKVAKSPIGKAALAVGLGAYGLGAGPFAKGSTMFGGKLAELAGSGFLQNLGIGAAVDEIPGGKVTAGIVGTSLLGGLLASKEPEQDINALSQRISDQTGIDVSKIRGEVQQAYQNKDTSTLAQKYPFLVNQEYSASFAEGGRTGFESGGTYKDFEEFMMKRQESMSQRQKEELRKQFENYMRSKDPTVEAAVGGKIEDKKEKEGIMMASAVGDESDDIAMQLFGKPVKELNPSEMQELQDEIDRLMNKFRSQKPREGIMMASNIENEKILESLFEKYLDMGLSPEDAAKKAMEEFDRMSMKEDMGRTMAAEGGMMNLGGNEMDLRGGGFVPIGAREKADDVPARLSKNEFVFTADAVRAAGGGSVDRGADLMYKTMKQLENKVV